MHELLWLKIIENANGKKSKLNYTTMKKYDKVQCKCGHLMYWSAKNKQYQCFCNNPKPFNK